MLTAELSVVLDATSGTPAAHVELVNTDDQVVVLDAVPLRVPALALQIRDSEGGPVLMPPPPVPGGDVAEVRLGAGERLVIDYPNFLPAWTPPGSYRVRFRSIIPRPWDAGTDAVESEWVELRLSG